MKVTMCMFQMMMTKKDGGYEVIHHKMCRKGFLARWAQCVLGR